MKTAIGLLLLLLPLPLAERAAAAEHKPPWETVGTFPVDSAPYPVADLTGRCPAPPPAGPCDYRYPVLEETCAVEEVREIGRFGDAQYLVIRSLRETTFDEGAGRTPFLCAADEIVLAAHAGGQARIIWRDATERTFFFISSAKLHTTPGGESILSVLYCTNGTGGCAQGMLIWHGGAWRELARDDSWDAVYAGLPADYRPHKSPEIDLGNLTWEQHLAHRNDANCCPSGRIEFRLAIVGGRLAVESHRIILPETPPE